MTYIEKAITKDLLVAAFENIEQSIQPRIKKLLLVTADSQIAPAHYIEVEAKLLTSPQPESGYLPSVGSAEVALGRDPYALIPAMAWAIALAAAALGGSLLAARWSRWGAWLVTIPVIIAIVWNLYESLSALLPNLY